MKVIATAIFLAGMALSAAVQTQNSATTPPQYSRPSREPVPESRTLDNAPAAPAFPADWTAQLAARHEMIVSDHLHIHVFRLRPGTTCWVESAPTLTRTTYRLRCC